MDAYADFYNMLVTTYAQDVIRESARARGTARVHQPVAGPGINGRLDRVRARRGVRPAETVR